LTAALTLLGVIAIVVAMDLTIKRAYRYRKKPHDTTPAAFGIPFEEIRIPTANNRQLYGWWIPANCASPHPGTTLILAHGWGRNVERMMPYVLKLHSVGYNLAAFDLRGHGSSDRDTYPNMLKFSEDIRATVDFLSARDARATINIGVIGLSVGGGAAIHAAATDARIRTAVTVGAIAHPLDVMKTEFAKRRLPYCPVGWLMLKYLQLRMGVNFNRIAPVNMIPSAQAKILLIHGEQDKVVSVEEGKRLQSAGNPATVELWVVPYKGHSDCNDNPDFWERVGSFLDDSLPTVNPRDEERQTATKRNDE
jgi:pimeloyl-ACP methyl ester carboxylesterase